ncbi:MAG: hypothetical protein RIR26_172 [Pseudomonadota bacterium]|jgi:hypothetical protein
MKYYFRTLSLLTAAFFASKSAQAADVNFNFRVNSSGADLYACDAGIYEPPLAGLMARGGAQSNVQASVSNYEPVSWSDRSVQANILPWPVPHFHTVAYPLGDEYTYGTSLIQRLNTKISNEESSTNNTKLTFNLASDYYGARYFVDFCLRGSQLPYLDGTHNYLISDGITATDIPSSTYLANAGLSVMAQIVCEERSSSTAEDWTTTNLRDSFGSHLHGLYGIGSGIYNEETTSQAFSGSVKRPFGLLHTFSLSKPAKYCVVRYIFEENSTAKRAWDLNSADFAVDLHINDVLYQPAL